VTAPGHRVAHVDPMPGCTCDQADEWTDLTGRYIGVGEPQAGQVPVACLSLDRTYDAYVRGQRKADGGNRQREARRAERLGLYVARFPMRLHVPDVVEINHSRPVRSGGPMRGHYTWSVEEHGGPPTRRHEFVWPECRHHWTIPWGVFEPRPGHRQGDVPVDGKLVAYLHVLRLGDLALYSQILGHGDFLRSGVMARLHFVVVEWLLDGASPHAAGVRHLMYGAWDSGGTGLQFWKRKLLFEPVLLVAA